MPINRVNAFVVVLLFAVGCGSGSGFDLALATAPVPILIPARHFLDFSPDEDVFVEEFIEEFIIEEFTRRVAPCAVSTMLPVPCW